MFRQLTDMKTEAVVTLDSDAADAAKHLAEAWGVTVQEAVKRALKSVDATSKQERIAAFLELSRSLELDDAKAQAWMDLVRDARR